MNDIKFDGKHVDFYSSDNKVTSFTINTIYVWIFTGGPLFVMLRDEQTCTYLKPNLL